MALPKGTPSTAKKHYRDMFALQALAVAAAARAWRRVDTTDIRASWRDQSENLVPVLSGAQLQAANAGASYGAMSLVESSGVWRPPSGFVDPQGFAGRTAKGVSWSSVLAVPAITALARIKDGARLDDAMQSGLLQLKRIAGTEVIDAARTAAGADVASRTGVGYIRLINAPSCKDCAVLAGRFYRWNAGFLRHPNCQCVHVPATSQAVEAGHTEGFFTDPYEYFQSLSPEDQDKVFGVSQAEAIRDGSDIYRVVNAQRGTSTAGDTTTALSSRYGAGRLTPEGIYRQAGSREEALRLLESNGYILPGGQVPGGSIRGSFYEGFGALGRGGTRVGASEAIRAARKAGVRDPNSRYTMTEAERRLSDARRRYEAVLEGRNPVGDGPLTPQIAAQAEQDFRRWLSTGGNIYAN